MKSKQVCADDVRIAYPLFQAEGGGVKPTSALQLRLKSISHLTARKVYRRWHYLGDAGLMSSFNYGVYFDGECVGAISYGIPNARNLFPYYTEQTQGKWLELKRLALSDACPKNSESRVIAVSIRMLKKDTSIEGIVTYADTEQGHIGIIYRASGFRYCGLTAPKTDLFVGGRKFGKHRGVKYSEIEGEWRPRSRKHLYVKDMK